MAADAVLGAAVGELLKAVLDVKDKAVKFKSILKNLASTLESIKPVFDDIEKLDKVLDRPPEETNTFTDRLKEAEKLVLKCSKIKWWNYCKKSDYAKKLIELEQSLLKFFQMEVQALISMHSRKILVVVNELNVKMEQMSSSRRNGGQVSEPRLFLGSCGVPGVSDLIVGLDVPLKELKLQLLKDGVSVVVLSAPGGCGKTTLAKLLCHDNEIKGIFGENIFFLTVSKKPNLKVIVQKVFQHKGYTVHEFQNDDDAITQLGNLLEQIKPDPVLLVLDDVWSGSESLVQNFMFKMPGYKILVTSRSEFPRFGSTYKLKLLNDEDAMTLFCNSAFPQDGSSSVPDHLVNEIVKGCRGFPLALTVVGRSLCGQPEVAWISTLKQWSEGQSIFDSNSDLLIRLQTSLDALDERVKECYLDLASFPEDERIPATALIDMWVELYNLDEDGVHALANLHELSTRNLVNLVFARNDAREVDGYYNEHFVMQHDLLRELAIHQSSHKPIEQRKRLIMDLRGNDLPKWSSEHIQRPIHARLLSISTDETFSSSWYNMQLPEVEVLILNFRARNYTLPKFMEKMDQLKALIIINYDFCPAELSNFPLLGSLSSLKRIRLEHVSISSLSKSTLKLRNLHKISLVMCEIGDAFRNLTAQIPDMLPNLVEIDIDCCNDLVEFPVGLCDIVHLKKLSITNCHELDALPEGFGKLANLEVLRLQNCTKLSDLPESIGSLHKLSFLDISDCLSMSKMPTRMGELCGLSKLNMRGCWGLSELPQSVKDLGQLKDVICDEETSYLWEPYMVHLSNLKINVLKEDINLNWLPNLHF
uniref:RPW8 domain-containing protein n=1 Tax=Davidia involucrata TaxID=16924 RepID=A0A5B7C9B9_DAVIN